MWRQTDSRRHKQHTQDNPVTANKQLIYTDVHAADCYGWIWFKCCTRFIIYLVPLCLPLQLTVSGLVTLSAAIGVMTQWHAQRGAHYLQRVACEPRVTCKEGRSAETQTHHCVQLLPFRWCVMMLSKGVCKSPLSRYFRKYVVLASWRGFYWIKHLQCQYMSIV